MCETLKVDLPIACLFLESIALLLSLPHVSGHGQKKWRSRGRRMSTGSLLSNSNPLSPLWVPILHRTAPCHGFHLLCDPTTQFSSSDSPFFVSTQHLSFLRNVQELFVKLLQAACRATKGCETSQVGHSSACICNASLNPPSLSLAYLWPWLCLPTQGIHYSVCWYNPLNTPSQGFLELFDIFLLQVNSAMTSPTQETWPHAGKGGVVKKCLM